MQLTLYFDVLSTIRIEPLQAVDVIEPIIGIFALPRAARFRHLVHQPFAGGVFAIFQLQRISRGTQLRRQPERQGHRHRATVTLERN